MSGFKITGFDELQKNLKNMQRKAKELEQRKEVSFSELFTSKFMRTYTEFGDIGELFDAGNFIVENEDDFDAIPEDKLDAHINATTRFASWEEMLEKATEEYITRQLGF